MKIKIVFSWNAVYPNKLMKTEVGETILLDEIGALDERPNKLAYLEIWQRLKKQFFERGRKLFAAEVIPNWKGSFRLENW